VGTGLCPRKGLGRGGEMLPRAVAVGIPGAVGEWTRGWKPPPATSRAPLGATVLWFRTGEHLPICSPAVPPTGTPGGLTVTIPGLGAGLREGGERMHLTCGGEPDATVCGEPFAWGDENA